MPLNWKWRLVVALVGVALWCHPGVAAKIEHFKDTEGTLHITNAGDPEAAKPGAAAAPGATAVPGPSPQTFPSPPLPSPSVNHSAEPEIAPQEGAPPPVAPSAPPEEQSAAPDTQAQTNPQRPPPQFQRRGRGPFPGGGGGVIGR